MNGRRRDRGAPRDLARRHVCGGLLLGGLGGLGAVGGLGALAGCGRRADPGGGGTLPLAEAERLYGRAPDPAAGTIAYQPGVAIVGDGARSIRALAADGLTWRLDAGARDAGRVRVGEIVFVTGRCVGRVHAVERDGDELRVVLGPVALTDVIRECDLELEEPVDLGRAVALVAPEFPGAESEVRPVAAERELADPRVICPDPAARRRLAASGVDVEALCREAGGGL